MVGQLLENTPLSLTITVENQVISTMIRCFVRITLQNRFRTQTGSTKISSNSKEPKSTWVTKNNY